MSQFNDEFREFICQQCHTWISGKLEESKI